MKKIALIFICLFLSSITYAADTIYSIGHTAGRDYWDLKTALAAKVGAIGAGNRIIFELYSTDIETNTITITSGWSGGANSWLVIRGTCPTYGTNYTSTQAGIQPAVAGDCIDDTSGSIQSLNLEISNLLLKPKPTGAGIAIYAEGGGVGRILRIAGCFIDGGYTTNTTGIYGANSNETFQIYNNVIISCRNYGGIRFTSTPREGYIYNNLIYRTNTCGVRVDAAGAYPLVLKNNYFGRNGTNTDYQGTTYFSTNSCNNFSSDTTADDNNLATSGTGVVSVSTGTYGLLNGVTSYFDAHISNTGTGYNGGANVYSDSFFSVTSDIDADVLTIRNDVGCDEYYTAISAVPPAEKPHIYIFQ